MDDAHKETRRTVGGEGVFVIDGTSATGSSGCPSSQVRWRVAISPPKAWCGGANGESGAGHDEEGLLVLGDVFCWRGRNFGLGLTNRQSCAPARCQDPGRC